MAMPRRGCVYLRHGSWERVRPDERRAAPRARRSVSGEAEAVGAVRTMCRMEVRAPRRAAARPRLSWFAVRITVHHMMVSCRNPRVSLCLTHNCCEVRRCRSRSPGSRVRVCLPRITRLLDIFSHRAACTMHETGRLLSRTDNYLVGWPVPAVCLNGRRLSGAETPSTPVR